MSSLGILCCCCGAGFWVQLEQTGMSVVPPLGSSEDVGRMEEVFRDNTDGSV